MTKTSSSSDTIRAILIDATKQEVRETSLEKQNTLAGMYKEIGCDLVTAAVILENEDTLLVDDEGLLKDPFSFFIFDGFHSPLAGNGILIGTNPESGETIDAKYSVEEIRRRVTFFNANQILELYAKEKQSEKEEQ